MPVGSVTYLCVVVDQPVEVGARGSRHCPFHVRYLVGVVGLHEHHLLHVETKWQIIVRLQHRDILFIY